MKGARQKLTLAARSEICAAAVNGDNASSQNVSGIGWSLTGGNTFLTFIPMGVVFSLLFSAACVLAAGAFSWPCRFAALCTSSISFPAQLFLSGSANPKVCKFVPDHNVKDIAKEMSCQA